MDAVALIGRLLVSLAAVLGLMWVIARRVKRTGGMRGAGAVDVLSRRQLSRTASVAVVRVLDRALILGITDGQVTLIGETDLAAAEKAVEREPRRVTRPRPTRPVDLSNKVTPDGRIMLAAPRTADGPLAGSALSPATWRQTVNTLRNLTTRS